MLKIQSYHEDGLQNLFKTHMNDLSVKNYKFIIFEKLRYDLVEMFIEYNH